MEPRKPIPPSSNGNPPSHPRGVPHSFHPGVPLEPAPQGGAQQAKGQHEEDPSRVPTATPAEGSHPDDPRWYRAGLRFRCTQCGQCCQSNGEYEHLYLTQSDVLALAGELGLAEAIFRERYTQDAEGWTTLRAQGPACTFLTQAGQCSVYEARPMQCRTWPFWQENLEREVWEGPLRAICPGLGQGERVPADEVDRIAKANERWYATDGGMLPEEE